MAWPGRPCLAASRFAQSAKSSIRSRSAAGFREPVSGRSPRASWASWPNSRCPSGTMRSRTRMALTTGVMATQGTSRSAPPERWLPSLVGGGLELQAADQVPSRLPVRARDGVGAASGAQRQDLSRAGACQVRADDECGRAQVAHQGLGLVEVERRPPWLSRDPAGHRDVHRAWPGTSRDFGGQSLAAGEPLDLAARCAGDGADVADGGRGLALEGGRGQGILAGDQGAEVCLQGGEPGGRGGAGAGCLDEALPLGPAGEDVPGQVLDQPHRPDEQRADGLLREGLGRVLPAARGRRGGQVVIEAEVFPRRAGDAGRAGAELVQGP